MMSTRPCLFGRAERTRAPAGEPHSVPENPRLMSLKCWPRSTHPAPLTGPQGQVCTHQTPFSSRGAADSSQVAGRLTDAPRIGRPPPGAHTVGFLFFSLTREEVQLPAGIQATGRSLLADSSGPGRAAGT